MPTSLTTPPGRRLCVTLLALTLLGPGCGRKKPPTASAKPPAAREAKDNRDTTMVRVLPRSGPVCRYQDVVVSTARPEGMATSLALPTGVKVTPRVEFGCTATVALYPADGDVIELPIGSGGAPEPIPLRGRQVVDRTLTLTQRASGTSWSVEVVQEDLDSIGLYDNTLEDFAFEPVRLIAVRLRKRSASRTVPYDTRILSEDPEVDRHDCKPSLLVVPFPPDAGPSPAPSGLPADPAGYLPAFLEVCSLEHEGAVALAVRDAGWDRLGLRISAQAFGVGPIDVVLPLGDESFLVADIIVDVPE
ncbi:MAG: hypothetical protein H6732_20025 [Alphaproteobacteria bacterium]|nr:hypothetical protein [Alphaproteobacteria bacterium]